MRAISILGIDIICVLCVHSAISSSSLSVESGEGGKERRNDWEYRQGEE